MKRMLRNENEGVNWSVEVVGNALRILIEHDGAPEDSMRRERVARDAKTAVLEAEALVAEQLLDGFVDTEATPRVSAERFFGDLHARWQMRAHAPSDTWWKELLQMPTALRDRFADEFVGLQKSRPWPEQREAEGWLRMQVQTQHTAPYLLALSGPQWMFALSALDMRSSDRPLGAKPLPAIPMLGETLLSLIETLPDPAYEGDLPSPAQHRGIYDFPFAPKEMARLTQLAQSPNANQATNAALLLAKAITTHRLTDHRERVAIDLSQRDILLALEAWRTGASFSCISWAPHVIELCVVRLGLRLHRDAKRPATSAELGRLLTKAMEAR